VRARLEIDDKFWVPEKHILAVDFSNHNTMLSVRCLYADGETREWNPKDIPMKAYEKLWDYEGRQPMLRPYIFMFEFMHRYEGIITSVGGERLQDISYNDTVAEGIDKQYGIWGFQVLWDSINGKPKKKKDGTVIDNSWKTNPWVWKYGIKPIC